MTDTDAREHAVAPDDTAAASVAPMDVAPELFPPAVSVLNTTDRGEQ